MFNPRDFSSVCKVKMSFVLSYYQSVISHVKMTGTDILIYLRYIYCILKLHKHRRSTSLNINDQFDSILHFIWKKNHSFSRFPELIAKNNEVALEAQH